VALSIEKYNHGQRNDGCQRGLPGLSLQLKFTFPTEKKNKKAKNRKKDRWCETSYDEPTRPTAAVKKKKQEKTVNIRGERGK
jgi:hypothetical protein